jgi:hypothetical protein
MSESKTKNRGLSRKQEAALVELCGGSLSLGQIAAKISVNPRTLHRWRTEDEQFIRRYRDMRRAMVEHGVARIQSLFDKAVDTLEANLSSGNRPSEVRASVSIIRQAMSGVELMDYAERIKELEKRFER